MPNNHTLNRDIVIHYNEADGKIVISTVEHSLTAPLLVKALPLETSVDTFKAKSPDEAERILGAGIFALLDLSCHKKIGIRDYIQLAAQARDEVTQTLYAVANNGDPASQYDLALTLISQAVHDRNWEMVEEAEIWLRRSSAQGFEKATQYLANSWEANKAILAERINRSS